VTLFFSHSTKSISLHNEKAISMAGAENRVTPQDSNEIALQEFEAGVKRSLKQADAGLVKAFKTKEEFLNHLKNLE
jgi:hypothetical protein